LDKVLVNNLGGYNGKPTKPGEPLRIIYGNVFPHSSKHVNLEVNVPVDSLYFPFNASSNGLSGPFGAINFVAGSHVDLMFHFTDANTHEGISPGTFFLTFTGIDMQKQGGRESVTVYDYLWFKTAEPSGIKTETSCDGMNSTFRATESAGVELIPTDHPMTMDNVHRNRSVTLLMPGTTSFKVTMRAESGWAGRNILFAGQSNLVCGKRSSCLGMTCESGYKTVHNAHHKICSGEECIKEKDHDACCEKDPEASMGSLGKDDMPEGDVGAA